MPCWYLSPTSEIIRVLGFGVWGLALRVEAFGSRFVVKPRKLEPGLRMISAGITYFISEEHEENEVPSVWFLLLGLPGAQKTYLVKGSIIYRNHAKEP